MEKRYIGIDIDGDTLRVAIAQPDKGRPILKERVKLRLETPDAAPAALAQIIGTTRLYGDRLAAALPAADACYRWVPLPFGEPKKVAAAGRLTLAAQLPVDMDDCLLSFQPPVRREQGTITAMAAVPKDRIAAFLEPFDRKDMPLHMLDPLPFAIARGVSASMENAVMLVLRDTESMICLLQDRNLIDCRLLPPLGDTDHAGQAAGLLRTTAGLCARAGAPDLPMVVLGPGATNDLVDALTRMGGNVANLDWPCRGGDLEAEFLPAAALAMRAGLPDRHGHANLRQDQFALRGEWAALKKQLACSGLLLVASLGILTGTAWLQYAHKTRTLENLQGQMQTLYRQTFPADKLTRDLYRQMQGRVGRSREEGRMLGLSGRPSALAVLQQISAATPENMVLDTRELRYDQEGITLEGTTDTFDSVNRLARALQETTMFAQVLVADAKQNAAGSRIDFRLQLNLQEEETR